MIREVDLVSYLPPYMQEYKEPVAALEAENPEFILVWTAADKTLNNRFISTADEDGIARYESMLGIYPSDEDTLESRRSRVQSKWFFTLSYTMRVLLQKLTVLCDDTDFTVSHNFTEGYTLTIITDLELYGQVDELYDMLERMLPENIVIVSYNNIPCDAYGEALFGGGMCFINSFTITGDFRETYEINQGVLFSGGTVYTDFLTLTNDSHETLAVDGAASSGGGVVETAMLQITNDFSETVTASGDAKAAFGVVYVDFIEISANS